jgi:hypothetical protein
MEAKPWIFFLALVFALGAPRTAFAGGDLVTIIRNVKNVTTENFSANSPSVLDGCITPGTHRVMRFDFVARNVGDGDVVAGQVPPAPCGACPCATAPVVGNYEWSNAHCHWHLRGFNTYSLSKRDDSNVKDGFKQAFCLMDYSRWDPSAPPRRYDCRDQGVQPKWEDIYSASLACQFVNMDGVGDGDYRLVASTNVLSAVAEDTFGNNSYAYAFRLSGNTVLPVGPEWSLLKRIPSGLDTEGQLSNLTGVSSDLHRWDAFGTQTNKIVHLKSIRDVVTTSVLDAPAGTILQNVGAVSRSRGTLELFATASNQLYWRSYVGSTWSGWSVVPTVSGAVYGISAIAMPSPSTRMDLFFMDASRNLGHASYVAGSWSAENLGQPAAGLSGVPAAVSTRPGTFDVFVQGAGESKLWHIYYENGGWSNFASFAEPVLVGSPAAAVRTPGTIDVMWRTNTSQLAHMYWNGASWSPIKTWLNPPGISLGSTPQLVAAGPEQIFASVQGSDSRPYVTQLQGTTWSNLYSPTATAGMNNKRPALISWATNRVDLIYSMTLSRVGQLSWF